MLRAGVGLSTEGDPTRAAAEAAGAALQSCGGARADLLFVFATTPHGPGFTRVTRTVAEVGGTAQVVGCSAAGVLAGEVEVEGGPGVAVLALRGAFEARRFFVPFSRHDGELVADAIAEAIGPVGGPDRLLVLLADCYNLSPEPVLRRLSALLPDVRVVGGGASEDGSVGEVAVFAGDAVSSNAVAGVLLGGQLRATAGVTHAVRRVGGVYRVTAARGNLVLGLDGRPAYEAFATVVPQPLLDDPRRAASVVLAGLPLADGGFVARNLLGVDATRGVVAVAAPVAEGQEFFFGVRDPEAARADLQQLLDAQGAAWQEGPAAAALYFNCLGRGRNLYGMSGLDTAYIRRRLGALPVAGFFSGAEIAPGSGFSRLHQYTGVLAMLGPGT
jgi:small ligand-binding sensory domain FIST